MCNVRSARPEPLRGPRVVYGQVQHLAVTSDLCPPRRSHVHGEHKILDSEAGVGVVSQCSGAKLSHAFFCSGRPPRWRYSERRAGT